MYKSLQKVRCEVQKKCTKKSGKNSFAGFSYFELKDFLPVANEEFAKVGLCPVFTIENTIDTTTGLIVEVAFLRIYHDNGVIEFTTPSADPQMSKQSAIQNLGAKHTYLKRYLYMNALELSESDIVDATSGKENPEPKKEVKATEKQVEMIRKIYDEENIKKMVSYYKVDKLEDLSMQQASEAIAKKKGK